MGFALSRTIVYWGFDCAEDSIPFHPLHFSHRHSERFTASMEL